MSLVLDASLTLSWYFEDEQTEDRLAVLDRVAGNGATVPFLWRFEVANALLIGVRRSRVDMTFVEEAAGHLEALPITVDPDSAQHLWIKTTALAHRHRLTAYDAVYLELVLRTGLPLASLDTALCEACRAEGGAVLPLDVPPLPPNPALPT